MKASDEGGGVPALEQLLSLARSSHPLVRAEAGRALVGYLGEPEADAALVRLIRDPDNTLPTTETAEALLARHDPAGVRLLAHGLADADEDSVTHALEVMWDETQTQSDYDGLLKRVEFVAGDPDPVIQRGAAILLDWFANP